MLEQELQNQETEQPQVSRQITPEPEPELFERYEIKSWNLTPRIYKILAASAILNVVGLLVFAQTNLLTRKGCESPLVSKVCDVLDTVYVGAKLLSNDKEFVDKSYEPSELGDADITYIDVSGQTPPLKYPEGYFALANPESFVPDVVDTNTPPGFEMPPTGSTPIPGITNNIPPTANPVAGGNDLLKKPQKLPPPLKNPIRNLPKSPLGDVNDMAASNPPGVKNTRPSNKVPTDANDSAAVKPKKEPTPPEQKSEPVTEVEINKRPLKDLGAYVNDLLAKEKNFKLETQFSVSAKGKLTKDGRLDPKSFKYLQASSPDPKMVEVVQESIEAIDASGYLQYLRDLSGKDLSLLLQQDDTNITAVVQSELESDTRARSIKSALELAISIVKMRKSGENADANDKDDLELLKNATIESKGKMIIIKFAIPKAIAQQLIQRKLLEQAKEPKQPNGTAVTEKPNLNAGK